MRTAYARRRPVVNTYLVRERDRRRLRELARVLLLLLPLGFALVGNIWVRVEVIRYGYRIHELEGELAQLNRRERELRLEAAYLASPQRVEARAEKELGMRPPTLEQTIFSGELAP